MNKTELRPAFEWTCDNCGTDQFERAIVPELNDEDIDEIKKSMEIETGELLSAPVSVVCKNCGTEFETLYYNED